MNLCTFFSPMYSFPVHSFLRELVVSESVKDISAGPEWCSSEFRSALASFLNQQVTQYSAARKVGGCKRRGAGACVE
jgi:hypothetical protein